MWDVTFTPDDSQLIAGIQSVRETVKGVDQTIHAYPTNFEVMANILCEKAQRNMTKDEWEIFVLPIDEDSPYQKTCTNYPGIQSSANVPIKKAGK